MHAMDNILENHSNPSSLFALLSPESEPSTVKFDTVMSIMGVVTGLLFIFSVYLIQSVYRLVKFKDLPLLLSICSLALSVFCKLFIKNHLIIGLLLYCILSVARDFISVDNYLNTSDLLREIDYLKVVFLFCTLVFDLYKW